LHIVLALKAGAHERELKGEWVIGILLFVITPAPTTKLLVNICSTPSSKEATVTPLGNIPGRPLFAIFQ
jgi:hypothetical protein